jgi:DNA-binding response OmpR family regulator
MAKQLLLIEDSPTQAAFFKSHFENNNYQVITANDGESGIEWLQNCKAQGHPPPHLIVLDYLLPGEDGLAVCKRLKNDIALRPIPVLMYSAETSLHNMTLAYEAGADYYVVKGGEDGQRHLELVIDAIFIRQTRTRNRSAERANTSAS